MNTVIETRKVKGFRRLDIGDNVNWVQLIVEPGEPEGLKIEGLPECIARVKSEVQDETLKIRLTGSLTDKVRDALTTSLTRKTVTYRLTAKNLSEIKICGLIQVNLEAYGEDRPVIIDRPPIPLKAPHPTD